MVEIKWIRSDGAEYEFIPKMKSSFYEKLDIYVMRKSHKELREIYREEERQGKREVEVKRARRVMGIMRIMKTEGKLKKSTRK